MTRRRDALLAEYQMMVADCAAMERAAEAMRRRMDGGGLDDPLVATDPALPSVPSLDGCKNTHERLVRMAEAWGGTVHCYDAADVLIDRGISKGTRDNLVPSLQKEMMARPDLWQYLRARTYFYLPHRHTRDGATGVAEDSPD